MSKKPAKKSKVQPPRPPVGTHHDRDALLNPKNPSAKPIGERRSTGKPFIRVEVQNSISYRLNDDIGARVFTHNEVCGKTIGALEADAFIRDWLGLEESDYLRITCVRHTFTHDVRKETIHNPEDVKAEQKYSIVCNSKDGSQKFLATFGPDLDEISWDENKRFALVGPWNTTQLRLESIKRHYPYLVFTVRHV